MLASIGITSAADDANATQQTSLGEDITTDEALGQIDDAKDSLADEEKTFAHIQTQINDARPGDVIKISGYYKGSGTAITINRDITIEGEYNSTVLDADEKSGIFRVIGHTDENGRHVSFNVVLKNLILKNGKKVSSYGTLSGEGGAIDGYKFDDDHYQTAYNCIVINCKAKEGGGFQHFNAVNCQFISNQASEKGGAMYEGTATNCIFTQNTAQYGGAIYKGSAQNSKFDSNNASLYGGAIYAAGSESISGCSFTNNFALYGAAIYANGNTVKNSYFKNNNAKTKANDIYNATALDCTFASYSSKSLFETKIVKSPKPKLTVSQSGKYFGEKTITVKVIDTNNNNKAISGASVTLKFSNGKKVTLKTNSKGIATYNMAFAPKTYKVTATYKSASAKLAKVKITKAPSKITAKKVKTAYGVKYLKIKVTNTKTKKAVNGAKLLVKAYTGKKAKKIYVTTDSKGIAQYGGGELKAGKHKIAVKSATSGIKAKGASSQMTITKSKATIAAAKMSATAGESKYFTVKVTGSKKKALHDVKVLLKIYTGKKAKSVYLTTDSKGTAKYNAKGLGIGSHKVVISVKTAAVKAKSKTSQITVKKAESNNGGNYLGELKETTIKTSILREYVYAASSIIGFTDTFTLYDKAANTAISGAVISVYVNGQFQKNITSGVKATIYATAGNRINLVYEMSYPYNGLNATFVFNV